MIFVFVKLVDVGNTWCCDILGVGEAYVFETYLMW